MWRIMLGFFVLSPAVAWAASICPAQIEISETTKASPPGFTVFFDFDNATKPHPLVGMDFFVGRLSDDGLDIPNPVSPSETNWGFPAKERVWVICRYRDSDLTLAHELPLNTTTCDIKLSDPQNGPLIGQRLVSSTKCR